MMTVAQLQLWIVGLSLLLIVVELPLAMNLIKPNHFYGFRVYRTLSDERVWYLVNSYAGKGSILTAIVTIILAVLLRPATTSPTLYEAICVAVLIGGLVLTIIKTLIYMKRIP